MHGETMKKETIRLASPFVAIDLQASFSNHYYKY